MSFYTFSVFCHTFEETAHSLNPFALISQTTDTGMIVPTAEMLYVLTDDRRILCGNIAYSGYQGQHPYH